MTHSCSIYLETSLQSYAIWAKLPAHSTGSELRSRLLSKNITDLFSLSSFSKSNISSIPHNNSCTASILTIHTTVEPAKHVNSRPYLTIDSTTILNTMDHARGVRDITAHSYGSLYTTAQVEKLIRVGTTKEPLMDPEGEDDITDEQDECLVHLTRTVYDYLVTNVDYRGFVYGLVPE